MSEKLEFSKKAFEVDLPDDFDPNKEPTDGLSYLQKVRWEASNCDDVVTVEIDELKRKSRAVVNVLPTCETVPVKYLPDRHWKHLQVADFSAVRQKIEKFRKINAVSPPINLPNINDEKQWCTICTGCKVEPLLSIVLPLSQPLVEWLLQCNVEWLSEIGKLSQHHGRWLYALMACLELPLSPETCSSLRALARECARIRAREVSEESDPSVTSLNLIICLVADYFGQTDLADVSIG